MKKLLILIAILTTPHISHANLYFVSNTGNDSNTGSFEYPLASLQKAQEKMSAGDTIYIRGGKYTIEESDISRIVSDLFACITYLDKSGEPNKLIHYWAYPGETPVFDFSNVKPANQRVAGIYIIGNYIHIKGIEMTGIQVTITTHTESYCIYSRGSNNIFENISMHDNRGTGLRHNNGGNNLFLNCDAYRNHDNVSENQRGGNSDGFGCHPNSSGTGNVFKGCRAWFNSDDGFDCIRADAAITFDNCWAFYNGYSPSFESLADGNGFKAGGYAYDEASKIPDPVPSNTIRYCLTVRNKANGFYSNHHLAGNTWDHNSAYQNGNNYNMVNRESPESDNINVPGYNHILRNNLSYNPRSKDTSYIDNETCTLLTNSFNLSLQLTDADFVSLNQSELTTSRKANGSLPDIDFMKPLKTSLLIDKGTDIGYGYSGTAPDIGAFEYIPKTSIHENQIRTTKPSIYPNPFKNQLNVSTSNIPSIAFIQIFNQNGTPIFSSILNKDIESIDLGDFTSGIYFIKIRDSQNCWNYKTVKR